MEIKTTGAPATHEPNLQLVSFAEAARMLSCSKQTVYRLVEAHELHPIRVLAYRKLRLGDVRDFIARRLAESQHEMGGDAA